MGETRERLTLSLLRARLTEERTGLVVRAWQPWFEALNRVVQSLEEGLSGDEEATGSLTERVTEIEENTVIAEATDFPVVRERKTTEDTPSPFSDVPQLAELVNRAFDTGAQFAAGEGSPPAPQALNLGRRSGEYYRRWALAI